MYAFYYFFLFPLFSTKGCRKERKIMVARSDSSDVLSWGASRVMRAASELVTGDNAHCDIVNIFSG